MPFGLASRKRVKALAARVANLDEQREAMAAQLDRLATSVDRLASGFGELSRRLDEGAAERQQQGEAVRTAVAGIDALTERASSLAASLDEHGRAAADVAEAVERQGRATADLSAIVERNRDAATELSATLDAHGRAQGELAAALEDRQTENAGRMRDLCSRLDTVEQRGDQRERTVDQVRADVMRIERQAAVDLALLRSTDEALARAVTRANAPAAELSA